MPRSTRIDAPSVLHHIIIRNLDGYAESKKLRLKGQGRLKGDERIMANSDFVTAILAEAILIKSIILRLTYMHT
jgi:hypothetical protein